MKSTKKKLLSFFIGLVMAAFLLEIGLRIISRIYLRKTISNEKLLSGSKNSCYTILCLGESFTFGTGATAGNDYPNQLKNLLNSRNKDKVFKIINHGIPGQNTSQLLNS